MAKTRWSQTQIVTFEVKSKVDMLAFCFVAIGPFLAEIWQITYLTLKIQGQGQGQGKSHGHIWAFNKYVCVLFHGNQTILVEI